MDTSENAAKARSKEVREPDAVGVFVQLARVKYHYAKRLFRHATNIHGDARLEGTDLVAPDRVGIEKVWAEAIRNHRIKQGRKAS